jgi:cytochrome c oxidase cbb3-type subunit II
MNQFRVFLAGLAVTFGLPWFVLLILPTLQMSSLAPLPVYELDENGQKVVDDSGNGNIVSYYPPLSSGSKTTGEAIYVREGCAQCHSQLIRDPRVAMDSYKRDWGSVFDSMAPMETRPTNPRDYLAEHYPVIGLRRLGGDLSNVAFRYGSREQMHLLLYDSRIAQPSSNMPPYRFLYETRKIEGKGPSVRALPLTGELAPEAGYEVIPTGDAEALVDYLMALKKNYTDPSKPVIAGAEAN